MYVGLSELFSRLQDADKSARYAAKAYDLSRSLQLGDLNSRHHRFVYTIYSTCRWWVSRYRLYLLCIVCRAALLQMASALRKQGELGDAQDYCSVSIVININSQCCENELVLCLVCSVCFERKRRGWPWYRAIRQPTHEVSASWVISIVRSLILMYVTIFYRCT